MQLNAYILINQCSKYQELYNNKVLHNNNVNIYAISRKLFV